MYKNRSRGLKRSLLEAPSNLEDENEATSVNRNAAVNMPEPSQPISKSRRKSNDKSSKENLTSPKENRTSPKGNRTSPRENRTSPKNAVKETLASPSQKKRKLEPSQRPKKAAPSFVLDDQPDCDTYMPLAAFSSKFEELVTKSGCSLREGSERHLLRKSQANFIRNLSALLSENDDICHQFMDGLKKAIENDYDKFHKMLLETEMDSADGEAHGLQQNSLVRMFLGVECIQPMVIELLLEKLAELIQRNSECRSDNRPWVILIIKKLCFLDQVVDGQSLQRDLFRLLEVAPLAAKQEIIYNLPYILGEKQDEELAACLINSMKSKKELTPVVLEALGHLPLGPEQRKDIQNKLLQSLQNSPVEYLPVICKFLLFNQNGETTDVNEVIDGLRSGLPFTKSGLKFLTKEIQSLAKSQKSGHAGNSPGRSAALREEIASSKTITFHNLRQAVVSNPKLLTAWYKNIKAVESVFHHKPIDIAMLLLMLSKEGTHRKAIEAVWKNRVTTGMFTDSLLEETFDVLLEVLKKHVNELIYVAAFLLRSSDPVMRHFGSEMYKMAFLKFDSSSLRQRVAWDLVTHVGSSESCAKAALEVMHELCNDHLTLMAELTICLQNLLDVIYDLDIGEVRRVMDFLCLLAFSPATMNLGGHTGSLQDCISILIRKYLYSHQRPMKHRGVVAAVMAIKHIASCSEDVHNTSASSLHSMSSLPPGRAYDALEQFNSIRRCTSNVPEEFGYSIDELSLMTMRTTSFDPTFLAHLMDDIENKFMSSYLPDEEGDASSSKDASLSQGDRDDIPMTAQYGLDKDVSDPIILTIGPMVLKEARHLNRGNATAQVHLDNWPILVVCPVFRLLQILKLRGGDSELNSIDALLGCLVTMPSEEVFAKFDDYSLSQQGDILDCLFHCVNWFRETVNAFIQVDKDGFSPKILIRLRNIVALQKQISRLLRSTMEYTPPVCNFHGKPAAISLKAPTVKRKKKPAKKKKKKAKKGKDSSMVDESSENEESSDKEEEENSDTEIAAGEVDMNLYRGYFREFDMSVFKIMKCELVLLPTPERGADTAPEFSPIELRLLLEDLIAKLNYALSGGAKRVGRGRPQARGDPDSKTAGFSVLDLFPPAEVAANAVELLPLLCEKLERLGEACKNLLDANDGLIDGPTMFEENVKNVKVCFGLLLEAIALTLSWSGFQLDQHSTLLVKAVKVLGTRIEGTSGRRTSLIPLLEESCSYLRTYTKLILDLKSAANFVRLLHVLSDHWERYFKRRPPAQQRKNPASEILHEVTKTFLQQTWSSLDGTPEQGVAYNRQIETLLEVYMTEAPNKIALIKSLVPDIAEESMSLAGKEKNATLRTFPVINRTNLHKLCQALLKGTVEGISARLIEAEKDSDEQLKIWHDAFKIMQKITEIVRDHPNRRNQANQLKWSAILLQKFLSKGMPLLECYLKTDREKVIAILKSSQLITRFNHKVCCSCKIANDSTLMTYVPRVKAVMESLVFRVKSILALHGAESAWWMGNLKNKDIADNEVEEGDDSVTDNTSVSGGKVPSPKKKSPKKRKTQEKSSKRRKSPPKRTSEDEESEKSNEESNEEADIEEDGSEDEASVSGTY